MDGGGVGEGGAVMAAAAGAVVVPVAVAAAQPAAGAVAAPNWTQVRLRWAQTLFFLGIAEAALAMFAMNSSPTAVALGPCAPTAQEAAALLVAAALVLGASTAVLLPACQLATIFVSTLAWLTSYYASVVLWLLVACHGHVHGARLVYFCFFFATFLVAVLVGFRVSLYGQCLG